MLNQYKNWKNQYRWIMILWIIFFIHAEKYSVQCNQWTTKIQICTMKVFIRFMLNQTCTLQMLSDHDFSGRVAYLLFQQRTFLNFLCNLGEYVSLLFLLLANHSKVYHELQCLEHILAHVTHSNVCKTSSHSNLCNSFERTQHFLGHTVILAF